VPSSNVNAVRRGTEAWARKDIDAMLREYDEHVEVVDPERAGPGPFRGHDAFRRWYAEWLESWEHYDVEHEAIVDLGDQVVLFQRHAGVAKGSGIALDHRGALLVGLREGKVVLHRPYTHRADALEAVGLTDGESWRTAIEAILAGYEAWNRRDVDALMGLLDPGAEFVPLPQGLMESFQIGEGMDSFVASSADTWEEYVIVPLVFVPAGDRVMVELDVRAKSRASGIALEERWAHVFTLRDTRLVRIQAFRSREEGLQALAYPDQP
jgi:ketosteroid isomerase-like protein